MDLRKCQERGREGKTFLISSGCIDKSHKHRHFHIRSATGRGRPARSIDCIFVSEISGGTIALIVLEEEAEEAEMSPVGCRSFLTDKLVDIVVSEMLR